MTRPRYLFKDAFTFLDHESNALCKSSATFRKACSQTEVQSRLSSAVESSIFRETSCFDIRSHVMRAHSLFFHVATIYHLNSAPVVPFGGDLMYHMSIVTYPLPGVRMPTAVM